MTLLFVHVLPGQKGAWPGWIGDGCRTLPSLPFSNRHCKDLKLLYRVFFTGWKWPSSLVPPKTQFVQSKYIHQFSFKDVLCVFSLYLNLYSINRWEMVTKGHLVHRFDQSWTNKAVDRPDNLSIVVVLGSLNRRASMLSTFSNFKMLSLFSNFKMLSIFSNWRLRKGHS